MMFDHDWPIASLEEHPSSRFLVRRGAFLLYKLKRLVSGLGEVGL